MNRLVLDLSQVNKKTHGDVAAAAPIKRERPGVSFEDLLSSSVREVNSLQLEADDKVRRLAIGEVDDVSEVVLASSRADVSMRLLIELRTKLLDAYQTLSRISG